MITGMFSLAGAVRKCSSILCAPARNFRKFSAPIEIASGRPIADHTE